MSRRKNQPEDNNRRAKPGLRTKIFVRDDMIGAGKIALLAQLEVSGSISAAARDMDLTYRRAWFLLDTLQRCFKDPLFTTERGGADAGGAKLTELGRELTNRHKAHEAKIQAGAKEFLNWLQTHQKED
ncbi:MAG: winged helix-turn-helix domain-containing protein [Pikeienuella sp.]